MKKYIINILDDAINDMENIYNYIAFALLSPASAKKQYIRISNAIMTLDTFPERFKILDNKFGRSIGLRKMIVDNFAIFYYVESASVTVIAVFYKASNIIEKIKNRYR